VTKWETQIGRLYDTYGASLYRYAVMILADAASAEDAVHSVFTAILRQPKPVNHELAYVRRAVRNECFSILRRRQRWVRCDAPEAILESLDESVSFDDRIALEQAIRDLPPEQREVIYLHVFEGLTFQEIADSTSVSLNTVAARHRYALARMKQLLTGRRRTPNL
jgi:RNA polymerase sigma-70 factor (ECF subfamily)